MLKLLKSKRLMSKKPSSQWIGQDDKVIIYTKKDIAFAFNFHPERSFTNYFVPVEEEGFYTVALSSDDKDFGGFDRVGKDICYKAERTSDGRLGFFCYLPNRCAIAFARK